MENNANQLTVWGEIRKKDWDEVLREVERWFVESKNLTRASAKTYTHAFRQFLDGKPLPKRKIYAAEMVIRALYETGLVDLSSWAPERLIRSLEDYLSERGISGKKAEKYLMLAEDFLYGRKRGVRSKNFPAVVKLLALIQGEKIDPERGRHVLDESEGDFELSESRVAARSSPAPNISENVSISLEPNGDFASVKNKIIERMNSIQERLKEMKRLEEEFEALRQALEHVQKAEELLSARVAFE